ncbi:hypothetical protein [Frankia sp. Cas3]|uniref:hypothetical protein n=1 Tax=Frankia sp. Cas3 TaxID=3073926 RepID=UPI002AD5286F|nr:hypothetical protein [Frankia sp. Cas3]
MTVVGVDTDIRSLSEIDHLVLDLWRRIGPPADAYACTHIVRVGVPHFAVSLTLPPGLVDTAVDGVRSVLPAAAVAVVEPGTPTPALGTDNPDPATGAMLAACDAAARTGGRAVRFPGVERLVGDVPVSSVLAGTAIDRFAVLGGGELPEAAVLRTRDFVRPEWRGEELVLAVGATGPGLVAPFEVPNPTPCCAYHA